MEKYGESHAPIIDKLDFDEFTDPGLRGKTKTKRFSDSNFLGKTKVGGIREAPPSRGREDLGPRSRRTGKTTDLSHRFVSLRRVDMSYILRSYFLSNFGSR